jgi:hypothetical protein
MLRDVIEAFNGHQMHAAEIGNVEPMFAGQIVAKIFRIDFNRAKSLKKAEAKKPAYR